MFPMIILCVAVLLLAAVPDPIARYIAIGLTVLALLATCFRWAPF